MRAARAVALAATALAVTLATAAMAIAAEDATAVAGHWSYDLDDYDVVVAGSADDALAVAQRLRGLDGALRKLLRLPKGADSPPTRIYLLPGTELAALDPVWASQGGAFFRVAPFDDYLVLASEHGAALDAELRVTRTLGLLASWGLARLPDWFRQGIAQLAAGAVVGAGTVTIGQDAADQMGRLAHGWIPIEKILRLPAGDAEFQGSAEQLALYRAQCWWLAHLLLIDRVLDPAIGQYIERLMAGQGQQSAFVATFNTTNYEQLDEYFRRLRRTVQLRSYTAELPPSAGTPAPRALGEASYRASVAQMALVHDERSAKGLQMAKDVLATDADNATALLALARAELGARHFTEADGLLQRLRAREDLPGNARRSLAGLELQLAKQTEDGLPGTQELDERRIHGAARADFRRVLEADPDDLRALYRLSWLQVMTGEVASVRELLPPVEAAYYRRSDSPELAALLVRMHSVAGAPADVFKYSVAEQRLAITEAERASAAARVARLRSQLKPTQ